MFLHCCILIVFSPHMCLSTLENKMWFFFFRFTWKYNKAQIRHSWSHTHWFDTPLTSHTQSYSHTHTQALQFVDTVQGNINKRVDPLVSRTLHVTATCQFQTLKLNSSNEASSSGYTDAFIWLSCLKQHTRSWASTDMLFWRL